MADTKTMSSNKKLVITIAVLACALLFALGAVIGVFAATSQTVQTSFNVSYSVSGNIAATVTAKHQVGTDAEVTWGEGISFGINDAPEGATYYSLAAPGNITLTLEKQTVVFTYTFENTGSTDFTAVLTETTDLSNVTIEYSDPDVVTDGVQVEAGETVNVTVTVSVENQDQTAWYRSNVEGGAVLQWALTGANA